MKGQLLPLNDIDREIGFLKLVRKRHDLETFKADGRDVRAASYALLIISEAVRRIPEAWLDQEPDIPWHAIRALGNKLRHEYHGISDAIIWNILEHHLEDLEQAVIRISSRHTRAG